MKKNSIYKRDVPGITFIEKSKTQQNIQDQVDISVIMKKYHAGESVHIPAASPYYYGDFSEIPDYQTGLNQIIESNERFLNLPSAIRTKFNNNPSELLDFLSEPKNWDEARELGILEKLPEANLANPPLPTINPETPVDKSTDKK